jgi:hypothetical protein
MRAVLFCILALIAVPARAEWVKVVESDKFVFYIDPTTISTNGDIRRVSELTDLKQQGVGGAMSMRGLTEYDCKERRHRLLSVSAYSGPMVGGQILTSDDAPDDWSSIATSSTGQTVSKIVCSK